MIQARDFIEPSLNRGYSFWTGVPCSFLTPLINYVIQCPNLDYVGAASEGEAIGIAAGAHLAGRKTVVICQNSGLGNCVNPLTSLNYIFRIPTLIVVTHRGAPDLRDEPQHELMGEITGNLLTTIRVPWEPFPEEERLIGAALDRAEFSMSKTEFAYGFVMKRGAVEETPLHKGPQTRPPEIATPSGLFSRPPCERITRLGAIRRVREVAGREAALIATTGKIGRELYSLGHAPNQFYVVGSMGCASSVALGVYLGAPSKRKVIVLDGDGAALMKMGTLATIGYTKPARFLHVILDNEVHESTGGQATVSSGIDFATIAAGCGYRKIWRADSADSLAAALSEENESSGPNLIHVKVSPISEFNAGRPSLSPLEWKSNFMTWFS